MSKGIVICGFSGIGKSTVGRKYDNVGEVGQSLYKHVYLDEEVYAMDREKRKNIRVGKIDNPEWPMNYIRRIEELRNEKDIVLIFTDFEILEQLREKKIPFIIALPEKDRLEEFIQNFRNRGQDEVYCGLVREKWASCIDKLLDMKEDKIILKAGEYLEEVLLSLGYI